MADIVTDDDALDGLVEDAPPVRYWLAAVEHMSLAPGGLDEQKAIFICEYSFEKGDGERGAPGAEGGAAAVLSRLLIFSEMDFFSSSAVARPILAIRSWCWQRIDDTRSVVHQ